MHLNYPAVGRDLRDMFLAHHRDYVDYCLCVGEEGAPELEPTFREMCETFARARSIFAELCPSGKKERPARVP